MATDHCRLSFRYPLIPHHLHSDRVRSVWTLHLAGELEFHEATLFPQFIETQTIKLYRKVYDMIPPLLAITEFVIILSDDETHVCTMAG